MKFVPQTILVYSGAEQVGDGIYKLPFLYHLRKHFPKARITWVAGKGHTVYAGLLAPMVKGLLDEVIDCAEIGRSWNEMKGPRPLTGRSFDLVIETGRVFRTTMIVRRIAHKTFVSGAAGYLLSSLRPKDPAKWFKKPATVVGIMSELAEVVTGEPVPAVTDIRLDDETRKLADALLPPGPIYVGFTPGSHDRVKCWPLDRYIEAARQAQTLGATPVFILGPSEKDWVDTVRAALPGAVLPLQDAPAITPWLTIALGKHLKMAVVNDCGAAHLLAAANVPLVSLFGPTRAKKFAPATPKLTLIQAQQWGGKSMDLIPTAWVTEAMETMLKESR